ncbi:MAG: hypothetical protein AB7S70_03945 [Hyphomicrobium sp.]|uniref:hypothetical protein n=1 Tax=Hyphomicrobium sp. TaxID=82 RepID=UPI003D12E7F5
MKVSARLLGLGIARAEALASRMRETAVARVEARLAARREARESERLAPARPETTPRGGR